MQEQVAAGNSTERSSSCKVPVALDTLVLIGWVISPMAAPAEQDATLRGMGRTPDLLTTASGVPEPEHITVFVVNSRGTQAGWSALRLDWPTNRPATRGEGNGGSPINSFP